MFLLGFTSHCHIPDVSFRLRILLSDSRCFFQASHPTVRFQMFLLGFTSHCHIPDVSFRLHIPLSDSRCFFQASPPTVIFRMFLLGFTSHLRIPYVSFRLHIPPSHSVCFFQASHPTVRFQMLLLGFTSQCQILFVSLSFTSHLQISDVSLVLFHLAFLPTFIFHSYPVFSKIFVSTSQLPDSAPIPPAVTVSHHFKYCTHLPPTIPFRNPIPSSAYRISCISEQEKSFSPIIAAPLHLLLSHPNPVTGPLSFLLFWILPYSVPDPLHFQTVADPWIRTLDYWISLLPTVGTFTSVFKDIKSLRNHKTVEINVFLSFYAG